VAEPSALYRLLGDDARLRLLRLLSLDRLNVTELTASWESRSRESPVTWGC
jgi:hypothetical protein